MSAPSPRLLAGRDGSFKDFGDGSAATLSRTMSPWNISVDMPRPRTIFSSAWPVQVPPQNQVCGCQIHQRRASFLRRQAYRTATVVLSRVCKFHNQISTRRFLYARMMQLCGGHYSGSYDPGYLSGDHDSCCSDDRPARNPFQMEKSRPSMEYSIYKAKGKIQRHWQRQTSSLRKGVSVAEAAKRSLPQLGVNLPTSSAGGVCCATTPPIPRPTGVESPPPPPSPDAMSEASDSAVLERVW